VAVDGGCPFNGDKGFHRSSLRAHMGYLAAKHGRAPAGSTTQLACAGNGIELAWNRRFLPEGHAVIDTVERDRLVLGRISAKVR
jgi:hypothetical protein